MKQRQHPVFILFACKCRRPREEAKRGKYGLICPEHGGVSVRYDMICENCDKPFSTETKGRNAFFCPPCKKPKGAGHVIGYHFKCGHRESRDTVVLSATEGRRPICSICKTPGVKNLLIRCECGVEFEAPPQGGSAKRCKECARVHAAASKDHKPAKKKETQELFCSRCKFRKRRMPKEGEKASNVIYCDECHTKVTSYSLSAPPKAMPDPIRVLPGGDKLEHLYTPLDVAEIANYYGAMSAGR